MFVPINSKPLSTVWETSDYSLFKKLDANRIVTDARVKKLLASFGEKVIDIPIIVNQYYQIMDGQGRFETRKRLNLPIPYIIIPDLDLTDCVRLNRYNSNWTIDDWVDSWASNINPMISSNYVRLKKCVLDYNISFTRAISLAKHYQRTTAIEEGKLIFDEDDIASVNDNVKKGNEIIEALCFTQRTNEAFWSSVKVASNTVGYNHAKMIKNCAACRSTYHQMSNVESQLKEFSRIYNYRSSKSSGKIFFEDYMRNKGYNVRSYTKEEWRTNRVDISTLQ